MLLAILAFFVMAGAIGGGYAAIAYLPGKLAGRQVEQRLRDMSSFDDAQAAADGVTVVKQRQNGLLPAFDHYLARSRTGTWIARLIEKSGVATTPTAIVGISLSMAVGAGLVGLLFAPSRWVALGAAAAAAMMPIAWLMNRRSARLKKFEELFPEALDLLSRAIRAGHAFQTAMGMVADEMVAPVGTEFKKTFDQQNYGLPLRDALNELSERVTLLDVRFFVTAVLIQRDTGGNLAEILDNLAHVVRERFKIRRQIRVHTAHGRFTGYVLLALPAALAVALLFLNPDMMNPLFHEHLGQMMLLGAMFMQTVGFFWIRQVVKIEV